MKTTTEMWSYNPTLRADNRKWVGYDVEATDGDIGTIDAESTEAGRGYLVVDTGFWIFGKKRLLPAASIRSVDHDARRVFLSVTKDQVKSAPDFEEMHRDDPTRYDEYTRYYTPLF